MKRSFCLLIGLALLFSLFSCRGGDQTGGGQNENHLPYGKDGVDEFISITEDMKGEGLISGFSITEDNIYNVTPDQVARETNYRIFKASDSCASFILIDSQIYLLCEYFGGFGFVNAVPCDFYEDGCTDLLVASSFGSGAHRSVISHFNVKTKESTVIFDTSLTDQSDRDLIVMAATPSFSSAEINNLPIYYNIYSVEISVEEGNLAKLSYLPSDVIGSVEYENGQVVFKSNEK